MAKQPVKQTTKLKNKPLAKQAAAKKPAGKKLYASSGRKKKAFTGGIFAAMLMGKRKWITLAIFVIVFGGLGTYLLNQSHALTTNKAYCVANTYGGSVKNGQCVKNIQRILNAIGVSSYYTGAVDGVYGTKTKGAVVNYQRSWGLSQDGIVGPKTWAQLCYTAYLNGTDSINAGNNSGCKVTGGGSTGSTSSSSSSNIVSSGACPSGTVNYGAQAGYKNGTKYTINTCGITDWPSNFANSQGKYVVEVNSKIAAQTRDMARAMKAAGKMVNTSLAFRTYSQQSCLYNYYKTGVRGCSPYTSRPSAASAPGYSNHQMGYSIDLPTGYTCSSPSFKSNIAANQWLNANMGKYGFSRDVGCSDYGHFTNKG